MTLDSDDVTIEIDLTVERGVGYLAAERSGAAAHRRHPGRRDLLAGAQGQLHGREHPRRPDDQLRQADHRDRDRRHDHAGGGALAAPPRSWSASSACSPAAGKRRSSAPTRRRGRRAGAAAEHAGHAHRGARPADARLQLAEAQQHRQGRPAAAAAGRGPAAHAQLRQEVARRDEGAPPDARLPAAGRRLRDASDVDAEDDARRRRWTRTRS